MCIRDRYILHPSCGLLQKATLVPTKLFKRMVCSASRGYNYSTITGVHNNEDLRLCETLGTYMGFCVHRGSWLLRPAVIGRLFALVHRWISWTLLLLLKTDAYFCSVLISAWNSSEWCFAQTERSPCHPSCVMCPVTQTCHHMARNITRNIISV